MEGLNNSNLPSEEQIATWKKQHGAVYTIDVEGEPVLIVRKPKIADLERAMASDPTKKKPFNFNRSIVTNCKLWVAEGALENDDTVQAIYGAIGDVIEASEGSIKKN